MEQEKEIPWLIIDDPMEDIIIGNKEGLEKLSEAIDKALECGESDFSNYVEDTSVSNVYLKSKGDYLNTISEYKESLKDKLVGFFLAVWFLALPFVAIGLIINYVVS